MKKLMAIPLIIMVLLTGATVNVATHYCNGAVADRTINLSGKLPTCGMPDNDNHQNGIAFTSHHCSNVKSSFTFSNTYETASTVIPDAAGHFLHNDFVPLGLALPEPPADVLNISNMPPGLYNPDHVDLEVICIYRI